MWLSTTSKKIEHAKSANPRQMWQPRQISPTTVIEYDECALIISHYSNTGVWQRNRIACCFFSSLRSANGVYRDRTAPLNAIGPIGLLDIEWFVKGWGLMWRVTWAVLFFDVLSEVFQFLGDWGRCVFNLHCFGFGP